MTMPSESTRPTQPTLFQDVFALVRHILGGRRRIILLSVAVLAIAAVLNWGWLGAIGVAPLLLAVAPCLAMCALGLCMKPGAKSCSKDAPGAPTPDAAIEPGDNSHN